MIEKIQEKSKSKEEIRQYSPQTLAYIGDGVFEIMVRTHLAAEKNIPPEVLHKKAKEYVSAKAQAAAAEAIREKFLPEEEEFYKRGRNTNAKFYRKNILVGDYRKATGLECLFGYLYMTGQNQRLRDIFSYVAESIEKS